jgi:hypothetical protein
LPRTKMLTSIAHNVAHSFLSLENYYEDPCDGSFDYVVERLFKIAKTSKQVEIIVDVLGQTIEPSVYQEPAIMKSLIRLKALFLRLLDAEVISIDFIQGATIRITFDLEKTGHDSKVPGLELSKYKCESEIVDINGKKYCKDVVEWWRY